MQQAECKPVPPTSCNRALQSNYGATQWQFLLRNDDDAAAVAQNYESVSSAAMQFYIVTKCNTVSQAAEYNSK